VPRLLWLCSQLRSYLSELCAEALDACLPASSVLLQARARRGELQHLESAQAFFDDAAHFREISGLCSYTHPRAWQDSPGAAQHEPRPVSKPPSLSTQRSLIRLIATGMGSSTMSLLLCFLLTSLQLSRQDLEALLPQSRWLRFLLCRRCPPQALPLAQGIEGALDAAAQAGLLRHLLGGPQGGWRAGRTLQQARTV
jgi:hypothetical protein